MEYSCFERRGEPKQSGCPDISSHEDLLWMLKYKAISMGHMIK
jgi:hypothetical protein